MLRPLAFAILALTLPAAGQNPVTLYDIAPGSTTSFPDGLTCQFGQELFFAADDGVSGNEFWKVDEQGALIQVADLEPGAAGSGPADWVEWFRAGASRTVFRVGDTLRTTSGTPGATQLLYDFGSGVNPRQLVSTDGLIYFLADDGVHGLELWVSDCTPAGTRMVVDLNPGPDGAFPTMLFGDVQLLFPWRGQVLFRGDDGVSGAEPWISDGTQAGTIQLADAQAGPGSSLPQEFTAFEDVVVFVADDGVHGAELWITGGTPSTTLLQEDVWPGPDSGLPNDFVVGDGRLWFDARPDAVTDVALMTSDLGPGGSSVVRGFSGSPTLFRRLTWASDRLFFSHANELWVSDGTSAGTFVLPVTSPNFLVPAGGGVYCYGYSPAVGVELHYSDGTAGGTFCAADVEPGTASSSPFDLTLCGGALFFSASAGGSGRELWAMQTPFAHTQPVGATCGPSWSTLACDDPVLGSTVSISGESAPAASAGLVYVEIPFPFALKLPQSDNCGIAGWPIVSFPVGISSADWAFDVTIPNDPSLVGARATLQAFFAFGSPLMRSSTHGLLLTLGD